MPDRIKFATILSDALQECINIFVAKYLVFYMPEYIRTWKDIRKFKLHNYKFYADWFDSLPKPRHS